MKNTMIKAIPHMTRHYRSETHWHIPHAAGQLTITLRKIKPTATHYIPGATYYKNATTTVSMTSESEFDAALAANTSGLYYDRPCTVKWILPDGTVAEGESIDAEVPEGETLCVCTDFRVYGIDTSDCDILRVRYRDLPPFQGPIHLRSRSNEPTAISEIPKGKAVYGAAKQYFPGGYRCIGTASSPSNTRGTIAEIDSLFTYAFKKRIHIQYAPYITGDLADIKSWAQKYHWGVYGTSGVRKYTPVLADPYSSALLTLTRDDTAMSFHHCGVHGVPDLTIGCTAIDWDYYACPNATPEDYDGLIDQLFANWLYGTICGPVDGVGFVYDASTNNVNFAPSLTCTNESKIVLGYSYAAGEKFIGAYGTLKISNRTADAAKRAEKLAILRAAGWTVEEIDDSLEEGIYAATV